MHFRSIAISSILCIAGLSANFDAASQAAFTDKVYRIYSADGVELTFAEAVDKMAAYDVVLFGEYHDNALIHWLQLKTAQALTARGELVMGGEMFETDGQLLLDEYLMGLVTDKAFEEQARLWPNYKTDYKPLVDFAKANGIPFIATNVPRRYASLVAKHGLDTLTHLPKASQVLMPTLPIAFTLETPGYEEMLGMMGGGHRMNFDPERFVQAQALKDATMADNIGRHAGAGKTFLHFNGDFHSADYGGIFWYLKNGFPDLKVTSVKVWSENLPEFQEEWKGSGDLIIVVPADFTKTH